MSLWHTHVIVSEKRLLHKSSQLICIRIAFHHLPDSNRKFIRFCCEATIQITPTQVYVFLLWHATAVLVLFVCRLTVWDRGCSELWCQWNQLPCSRHVECQVRQGLDQQIQCQGQNPSLIFRVLVCFHGWSLVAREDITYSHSNTIESALTVLSHGKLVVAWLDMNNNRH